jgi:hypothetical protein
MPVENGGFIRSLSKIRSTSPSSLGARSASLAREAKKQRSMAEFFPLGSKVALIFPASASERAHRQSA